VDQFLNFSPKEGLSSLPFGLTGVGAPPQGKWGLLIVLKAELVL